MRHVTANSEFPQTSPNLPLLACIIACVCFWVALGCAIWLFVG
jgi:hypothetical protein